jgi:hypothetical protein
MIRSILVASAISAVYLIWAPPSADLAAQTYRADLFAEHGFVVWSTDWYGGFHVPAYSILYPPLAAWLGVRVAGVIAAVAGAALFAALAGRRFGGRAGFASLWFAAGIAAWLFTGRMPFLLGIAIGLGALLAAEHRRLATAALLAGGAALASPVAGLFTGLAGVAIGLAGQRAMGAALALPPGIAIAVLSLAFPTGGEEPFVFTSFLGVALFVLAALWVIPVEQRELRIGVLLYALLALAVFIVPNPLGGNLSRLGALFAGPIVALVVWRRPVVLVPLVVLALYWQLNAPIRDTITGLGDPSTERSFFEPLLAELDAETASAATAEAVRVEVPPTRNRWEAVYVADRYPLARGWLRQLESDDFGLFDDGELTAPAYREWLTEHGVSYVAVPEGVERDYLAEDEAELITAGLDYLEPVWASADWRLYRVVDPPPLRYRWTPYWRVAEGRGCVERDGDWTRVEPADGEGVELATRFSLRAAVGRDHVCSG